MDASIRRRFAIDHLDDHQRHRRHLPRREQRREPAAVLQRADARAAAPSRHPRSHAQRPRRAVHRRGSQLGREGSAHRIRAAEHHARREGQLRRPRRADVPPPRSRDDDGAVRDGDDVRRLERDARAGAARRRPRSTRSSPDRSSACWIRRRSTSRSRAASISTRRSSGCRRRRCRSAAWRRSKAPSPARRATSPPTCTVASNTLDVGRERAPRSRGPDPGDVRVVLGTRPGDRAAVGRSRFAPSSRCRGAGAAISTAERGMERPRLAGRVAAGRCRPAGDWRGVRRIGHVRVQRAAAIRDRQSLAPAARAAAWCR